MSNRLWIVLSMVLSVVASLPAESLCADPPEGAPAIELRRVFAPADRIQGWPFGTQRYLPVDGAEFEKLLTAAELTAPDLPAASPARITSAQYEARLSTESLATGQATLDVVLTGTTPGLIALRPCNMAISGAAWSDATHAPAVMGCGPDGGLELLVEHSGRLRFDWTLQGRSEGAAGVRFQLQLPDSPVNRVTWTLPEKMLLSASRGVVGAIGTAAAGNRVWQVELGGHHACEVCMLHAPNGVRPEMALLRQTTVYDCTPAGVDILAQWNLDVRCLPLRQVTAVVDPGLRVVAIRCGGAMVPWSVLPAQKDNLRRITLRLPELIEGNGQVVQLSAVAPIVVDRPWRLPRIMPEGLSWEQASLAIQISSPLLAATMIGDGCRQSGAGRLPAPRSGETAQFECNTPEATVELQLAREPPRLQLATGTVVELRATGLKGEVIADYRATGGEVFALEADTARDWIIDSVVTTPASLLDDWSIEDVGPKLKLKLRLTRALAPARPVRVRVEARKLHSPLGRKLTLDELLPLRFVARDDVKRLVAVEAALPYELNVSAAERLNRIDFRSLDPGERDLFGGDLPHDFMFVDDPGAAPLKMAIEHRKPGFTATVRLRITASEGKLHESYRFHCAPESARLDRVLISFVPPREAPIHWSLGGGDPQQWSARRLSRAESPASQVSPEEEVWEFILRRPRPRGEPFDIRANRDTAFTGPLPVSLATLPEAASQRGAVVIRSLGPRGVQIKSHHLVPAAPEPAGASGAQPAEPSYRYDPARDVGSTPDAALVVAPTLDPTLPVTCVLRAELRSRYQPDGSGVHMAVYRLETSGGGRFRLTLPSDLKPDGVYAVWVDASPTEWQMDGTGAERAMSVELPAGTRFPTLTLQFATAGKPLSAIGTLAPSLLGCTVPVLVQYWSVLLPPGYDVFNSDSQRLLCKTTKATWSQRLFGPLGRRAGEQSSSIDRSGADDMPDAPTSPTAVDSQASNSGPWTIPAVAKNEPTDTPGWSKICMELVPGQPATAAFARRSSMRLFGSLAFLAVIAIGSWNIVQRPAVAAMFLALFGSAALLAPEGYIPITSGLVLGTLCCLVGSLAFRSYTAAKKPTGATGSASARGATGSAGAIVTGAAILLALAAATSAGPAQGQPPEKKTATATVPYFNVFIPTDNHQQPTGGKYYVPEELYSLLYHRAAAASGQMPDWLMRAAVYRGVLAWQAAPERLGLVELKATFDIHVFGPSAVVRIPLPRAKSNLAADAALLDGHPVHWEGDAPEQIAVTVNEPGLHRLELDLRPALNTREGRTGFELPIPSLVTSRLELALPAGAPAIAVPAALGLVRQEEDPPHLAADLGPSPVLAVTWPENARRGSRTAIDMEELLWLKVLPSSVILDARFRFKVIEGRLHAVQLAADSRLRLLPFQSDNAPTAEVQSSSGASQRIRLEFPKPIVDRTVVDASFIVGNLSSVGNVTVPPLDAVGLRVVKRCLAVSIDPSLEWDRRAPAGPEALAITSFLADWDAEGAKTMIDGSKPLVAYRLSASQPPWTLAIRRKRAATSVEQTLAVTYGQGVADVQFDAQLSTTSGPCFQHRLTATPELEIDRVSLMAEESERIVRCVRDRNGAITLFLNGPIAGKQSLSLRGHIGTAISGTGALPLVQLEQGVVTSSTIEVYRRPTTLVRISKTVGLTEIENPAIDPAKSDLGRLVKAFRADVKQNSAATVAIEPNQPKVAVDQVIRLSHDGQAWTARSDFRLDVRGGVVDRLEVEAPTPWNGPLVVEPAVPFQIIDPPGQTRRVVITPVAAISGAYRFSISSPLTPVAGSVVSPPDIRLLYFPPQKRWVVLPTLRAGQPCVWETPGLLPAVLPPDLAAGLAPQAVATYQVFSEPMRATLKPEEHPDSPQIQLADVAIAWPGQSLFRGVATFDLRAGRQHELSIEIPSGCQLLSVSVCGIPIKPESQDANSWKVPVLAGIAIQPIEVVYSGIARSDPAATAVEFQRPIPTGIPVRQTIWSVIGPGPTRFHGQGVSQLDRIQSGTMRLENLLAMIELGPTAEAGDMEESAQWYRRWTQRLVPVRKAIDQELAQNPPGSAAGTDAIAKLKADLHAADQQRSRVARWLAVNASSTAETAGSDTTDLGQLLTQYPQIAASEAESLVEGSAPLVVCGFSRSGDIVDHRWLRSGVWLALVALVLAGTRAGIWQPLIGRMPWLAVLALGATWCCWLSPGWFGYLLMAAAVVVFLRRRMATRIGKSGPI